MQTVDREPRHLTPPVDPSWNYVLPAEYRDPPSDVWEPEDVEVLLDLAEEKLEKVAV